MQVQCYHKASTAMVYEYRIPKHTRNFDKHQKTFHGRKENICLASHTVEQHFHFLFTSSQESRQFLYWVRKGILKMAIVTLICFSPINICSKSSHASHSVYIKQCQNCCDLAEFLMCGGCDLSSNACMDPFTKGRAIAHRARWSWCLQAILA